MDDPQLVGFAEPFTDLPGDGDGLAGAQPPDLPDELPEVLAADVLHGDVAGALRLSQVKHLADVLMADLTGELQLVREALQGLPVQDGFGPEELQGDFLADLGVVDLVNPAHAARTELLDDLVATGEGRAGRQLLRGRFQGFGDRGEGLSWFPGRIEPGGALPAVGRLGWVLELALRALHGRFPRKWS
jgi:hypothetical protein